MMKRQGYIELSEIGLSDEVRTLYKDLNYLEASSGRYSISLENSITVLRLDNYLYISSDAPYEKLANKEFVEKATGDVLIAGLGLGLIIKAIQDKPDVTSITVIEIDQDIIDMILPIAGFNDKVKVIKNDIWNFVPEIKYDTLYTDITGMCPLYSKELFIEGFQKYKKNFDSFISGRGVLN